MLITISSNHPHAYQFLCSCMKNYSTLTMLVRFQRLRNNVEFL